MFKGFRQIFLLFILTSLTIQAGEFFPVEDLRPGMVGEGITVLQGETPIRFKVEILGVLSAIAPDYPMVLGRMDHPQIDHTGIVAGMSGSPVYIDGRLLGAVAYGWPFSKDALCGITPVEVMKQRIAPAAMTTRLYPSILDAMKEQDYGSIPDLFVTSLNYAGTPPSGFSTIPLLLSGADSLPFFRDIFNSMGFQSSGGSVTKGNTSTSSLKPGDPVAAVMALGPQPLFASGTVTLVEGQEVYAFGHPFLGRGKVNIPIARAHPVHSVASVFRSFRMSNLGEILGSFTFDSRSAVYGELGKESEMVPVSVKTRADRTDSYRIMKDPLFTPLLIGWSLQSSLTEHPGVTGEGVFELNMALTLKESRVISLSERFSGPSAMRDMLGYTLGIVTIVTQNPFIRMDIAGMDIEILWEEGVRWTTLTSLLPQSGSVRPGEPFSATLVFENELGERRLERVETLAPQFPNGAKPVLYAVNGRSLTSLREKIIKRTFSSFDGLLRYFKQLQPSNTVHLFWVYKRPGVMHENLYIPEVGPRLKRLLKQGKKIPYSLKNEKVLTLPCPVRGWQKVKLTVNPREVGHP